MKLKLWVLVGALALAGCLEGGVDESAEPETTDVSPQADPVPTSEPASDPGPAAAPANGTGGTNITVVTGGVVVNENASHTFDVSPQAAAGAEAQADADANAQATQRVRVEVEAQSLSSQPALLLVIVKDRASDQVLEQRQVIVNDNRTTTNLIVNSTGQENVVVVTQTLDGSAQVNVAAHEAGAQIGNETEIRNGENINIGVGGNATNVEDSPTLSNTTGPTIVQEDSEAQQTTVGVEQPTNGSANATVGVGQDA